MAYEDPQLLHQDELLTGISVAYDMNASYIGGQLFPTVRVNKQSDRYRVFTKDNAARVTNDFRAPGSRANELPPMTLPGEDTYFAEEHALKDVVDETELQNADAEFDPLGDATERLTDTILLNREYSIVSMVTDATNYAPGHTTTLAGAAQWSDPGSNPATALRAARLTARTDIFRPYNTVVLGWRVTWALEDHPAFLDLVKNAGIWRTNEELLAQWLRMPDRVMTAEAQYNVAPYGQEAVMVDLWGDDVLLAYVPDNPGEREPAFGYEFAWPFPGGEVMPTERWYDNDRTSDIVRVRRRYDLKFTAIDGAGKAIGGYLIKDAVA